MRTAILRAAQAADRLHKEFGTKPYTDGEEGRINVFGMMAGRDLPVMFRPLDKLLGAYLNEGSPGVIITTQRQLPVQRFTAAHELGHAVLGHTPSLDPEDTVMCSPFGAKVAAGYDIQEIQANAFASQLLLPSWLLAKHVRRQRWAPEKLVEPDMVYQLSLRLGASYSATCHALLSSKAVNQPTYDNLTNVKPREIKKRLLNSYEPENYKGDVWLPYVWGEDSLNPRSTRSRRSTRRGRFRSFDALRGALAARIQPCLILRAFFLRAILVLITRAVISERNSV